jgi:hypothetical protein
VDNPRQRCEAPRGDIFLLYFRVVNIFDKYEEEKMSSNMLQQHPKKTDSKTHLCSHTHTHTHTHSQDMEAYISAKLHATLISEMRKIKSPG